jgi:hypothetical protein
VDDVDPHDASQRCGSRANLVGRVPLRCVRIRRPTSPEGRIRTRILGLGFGDAAKQRRGLSAHTGAANDLKSLQAGVPDMRGERHLKALLLDPSDYWDRWAMSRVFSRKARIPAIAAF